MHEDQLEDQPSSARIWEVFSQVLPVDESVQYNNIECFKSVVGVHKQREKVCHVRDACKISLTRHVRSGERTY